MSKASKEKALQRAARALAFGEKLQAQYKRQRPAGERAQAALDAAAAQAGTIEEMSTAGLIAHCKEMTK